MGNLEFGMPNRIYTKQSRKPFPARRKNSILKKTTYKKAFKIKLSKSVRDLIFIIFSFFIALLVFSIIIPRWVSYESEHKVIVSDYRTNKKYREFKFLMNSGLKRFRQNNIIGAYSEFSLAHKIYPNNSETSKLLEDILVILCIERNSHCKELDELKFEK